MTSACATSNLEISDPLIEMISNNVCYLEVLKFRPFESDLEDAIKDPMEEKIMNTAFVEREYTITSNNKFLLVSWDVGRPGLWYGIELFYSRSQFYKMERNWPDGLGRGQSKTIFTALSYDDVQCPGSKVYFHSVSAKQPYYCTILEMESYTSCHKELKKYEILTLHFPLVPEDYMTSHGRLELQRDPSVLNSCRSEVIRLYELYERMVASNAKTESEKLVKSCQHKRPSPAVRQLTLCSNKRQKIK
jgi:hypothetical protein